MKMNKCKMNITKFSECSWVMALKLSKKVHFFQFCADFRKKTKSGKAFYIYASEISHYAFSENGIVYRAMSHRSWDTSN